jgi:putative transcriptional regulator
MSFTIHNKITALRNERGVIQEELAQAVEVSRQTIIALEKGNYTPSLLLAMRISHFFAKPIEDVFSLEELVDKK